MSGPLTRLDGWGELWASAAPARILAARCQSMSPRARRKRWVWVGFGLLLLLALVALFEPTQTVRGILRGEAIYSGRPTRYWREVLRADGETGAVSERTVERLGSHRAIPVLLECLEDPDPNVRWPAANLIGRFVGRSVGFNDRVLPGLRRALGDEDVEVRLQTVLVMIRIGPNARAAIPDLVPLLRDLDPQVRHYADIALWEADARMAPALTGWTVYTSPEWGFSATFPSAPKEGQQPVVRWNSQVVIHSFMAPHIAAQCAVAVSDHPGEVIKALSEGERLEAARDAITLAGGKLRVEQEVEQNGLKGRECEFEVEGKGVIRTKFFWVKQRLYQVAVTLDPKFPNSPKAAEYFLNSFRLGTAPP